MLLNLVWVLVKMIYMSRLIQRMISHFGTYVKY